MRRTRRMGSISMLKRLDYQLFGVLPRAWTIDFDQRVSDVIDVPGIKGRVGQHYKSFTGLLKTGGWP